MCAHRRIDSAWPLKRSHYLPIQRLTHAVQALELVLASYIATADVLRYVDNGRQRMRVVRSKLRVHSIQGSQQFLSAGEIRHICVVLAGVDRVIALPVQLRTFDLAVPIRAFDQTHH